MTCAVTFTCDYCQRIAQSDWYILRQVGWVKLVGSDDIHFCGNACAAAHEEVVA